MFRILRKLLADRWPQRHLIPWQSQVEHPLAFYVRGKWWPPFAATEFFAPRYWVKIVNHGEGMDNIEVQVTAIPYGGAPYDIPNLRHGWREVVPYRRLGPLATGASRVMHITIPTGLLDVGTHALRLHVLRITTKDLPRGQSRGHAVGFAFLNEYLRVEPIATVITLAVAAGTFLTALATLVLALS